MIKINNDHNKKLNINLQLTNGILDLDRAKKFLYKNKTTSHYEIDEKDDSNIKETYLSTISYKENNNNNIINPQTFDELQSSKSTCSNCVFYKKRLIDYKESLFLINKRIVSINEEMRIITESNQSLLFEISDLRKKIQEDRIKFTLLSYEKGNDNENSILKQRVNEVINEKDLYYKQYQFMSLRYQRLAQLVKKLVFNDDLRKDASHCDCCLFRNENNQFSTNYKIDEYGKRYIEYKEYMKE